MSYREWQDDARGARGRHHDDGWLDSEETYVERPADRGYTGRRFARSDYDDRDYTDTGSRGSRSGGRHSREAPEETGGWSTPDRFDDTGAWTRGDHTGEWRRDDDWPVRPRSSEPPATGYGNGWSEQTDRSWSDRSGRSWSEQTRRSWSAETEISGYAEPGRRRRERRDPDETRDYTDYDSGDRYRSGPSAPSAYWTDAPPASGPPSSGVPYSSRPSSSVPYSAPPSSGRRSSGRPPPGPPSSGPPLSDPPAGGSYRGSAPRPRYADYRKGSDYQQEPGYGREPDRYEDTGYRQRRGSEETSYRQEPAYRDPPSYRDEPTYREPPSYRQEAPPPYRERPDYRREDPPSYRREPGVYREESGFDAAPAYRERESVRRRPSVAQPQRRPFRIDDDEDEFDDEPSPGGYLASALYTVMWFAVPMVAWIVWSLTLNGEAAANCVDNSGVPCASDRTEALTTLVNSLPKLGTILVLSLVVAMVLRWVSETWRAATVGFAAAVVGGGAATVIVSIITGQSLG